MYPQVFGKYVLERELARGGMARVTLATLRGAGGFEKKLVVKQIRDELACDDEFVRRFVDEAKTTVALAHPNIVPVYELGVERGTYFLVMELVEGASASELLRARSPFGLSPEEGAYIGVEVCRALDYAHRRMNLVHRDVTPRNVMVDEEGHVKVIDFGIAAPVATAPSGHGIFGSPGHMPPEQMDGKELTPAADVFAVAALLMELWTGKAPFRRRTTAEIEEAMRGPRPRPSDADPRLLPLDDVIASALSLDPLERPQQADDLARTLRRFLGGIDLGDLAHQLGDRVRSVRAHPPVAQAEVAPVLQRPPSRPVATSFGTKTFAARELVRPPSAAGTPSQANEPSTRRTLSQQPAAPASGAVSGRPAPSGAAGARKETGRRRQRWLGLGALAAGAIAIGSFFIGRGLASPSTKEPPAAAGPPVVAAAPPAIVVAVPPSPASASIAIPAQSGNAPLAHVFSSELALFGDGTRVKVDGVPRGSCPTRVNVGPGPHTVEFSFPATGESEVQPLNLQGGEKITLRADFTGAKPTVRIER
jgi:eukaryotic-like serine/threonine-protein kinase